MFQKPTLVFNRAVKIEFKVIRAVVVLAKRMEAWHTQGKAWQNTIISINRSKIQTENRKYNNDLKHPIKPLPQVNVTCHKQICNAACSINGHTI